MGDGVVKAFVDADYGFRQGGLGVSPPAGETTMVTGAFVCIASMVLERDSVVGLERAGEATCQVAAGEFEDAGGLGAGGGEVEDGGRVVGECEQDGLKGCLVYFAGDGEEVGESDRCSCDGAVGRQRAC